MLSFHIYSWFVFFFIRIRCWSGSLGHDTMYRLLLQGGRAAAGSDCAGVGPLDPGGKCSCGSPLKPDTLKLTL